MRHGVLLEEYIFRLKQMFGDSLFKRFDTEPSGLNSVIMKRAGGRVRPNTPAAIQIPEVQRLQIGLMSSPDSEELRSNVS